MRLKIAVSAVQFLTWRQGMLRRLRGVSNASETTVANAMSSAVITSTPLDCRKPKAERLKRWTALAEYLDFPAVGETIAADGLPDR